MTSILVGPVAAAPSQRVSDTEMFLYCDSLASDAGTVFVYVGESEAFGSFVDLSVWDPAAPPFQSNPLWITLTGSADFDGTSATASFDLVEFVEPPNPWDPPYGDPVGTATLEASLTPVGGPQAYDSRDRSGNQSFRRQGVFQEYAVGGTLELPDGSDVDLGSCFAGRDEYTAFMTSPAAYVNQYSDFYLSCFWDVGDTFIGLFANSGPYGTWADLFLGSPDGDLFGAPNGPVVLTTDTLSASFDLFDGADPSGSPAVGSAAASASLSAGGRINERFSSGNSKLHITGTSFGVDGSLSISTPDGDHDLPMSPDNCYAADTRVVQHESPRQGPRGKPLSNDAPAGALPIGLGESVTVRTLGTAVDAEAPCADGPFEYPISKTAWWTFAGTGGDVTVDTAGSDFDTIVGIYVDDGGDGIVNIGCVDDDESLQARITVATDAGVTYYIQAGGFAGAAGTLVLTLD